jgi:hypothetical protein
MSPRPDPDLYRSDSLANVLGTLTGPLTGGAIATPLPPTGAGELAVGWTARRPLVVARLVQSLEARSISLDLVLDPAGAATSLPTLRFAVYSEAGATLPLHAPPLPKGADTVPPFNVGLSVALHSESGTIPVDSIDIPKYLSFELLEGNLGKLLLVLLQEKARLRRQARELAAMKQLPGARRDALDRIGAGLGVLRFQDELHYDAGKDEIVADTRKDAAGKATLESDADYARRLAIYRPFLLSSPARLREMLNGPGAAGAPNTGLLAGLGLAARFRVSEEDNPFAVAVHIVGVGDETPRNNFLDYVRADMLVWMPDSPAAKATHTARYLPLATQAATDALRQRLRSAYNFPADAAVAPVLAQALDRLGRVLAALGHGGKLTIQRAQSNTGGSRYELGLGIDLLAFVASDLDDLAARVNDSNRVPANDIEAEALITAARAGPPQSSSVDSDGRWLLTACGFQTVHRTGPGTLYLSHLRCLGLAIDGPSSVAMGAPGYFMAHFFPAGDEAINAALSSGMQGALADWVAGGRAAWSQLSAADARTAWDTAANLAPNALPLQVFASAGLPAVPNPASLVTSLKQLPADMLVTLQLDAGLAADVVAGKSSAGTALAALVASFETHSLASALPLITATSQVLIVASVMGLPQIGVNLSDRQTSGFRWYAVPLGGRGTIKALGSDTVLTPNHAGALAIVCLAYHRQGLADPYEVSIDLPEDVAITLSQYEFLMNLLEYLCPIGVGINTYAVRQSHVDLAGSGSPSPLKPAVSRTYRRFQSRRLRGFY